MWLGSMRNLREVVALKKASRLNAVVVERREGRGRCVIAAAMQPAGMLVDALSGPAFAACLLRSNGEHCEHCFKNLSADSTIAACPRGCQAVYCSEGCRRADFQLWDHERTFTKAVLQPSVLLHAARSAQSLLPAAPHSSTSRQPPAVPVPL